MEEKKMNMGKNTGNTTTSLIKNIGMVLFSAVIVVMCCGVMYFTVTNALAEGAGMLLGNFEVLFILATMAAGTLIMLTVAWVFLNCGKRSAEVPFKLMKVVVTAYLVIMGAGLAFSLIAG